MEKIVTASDANRGFSRLLDRVRKGASYIVTAHGKPVAKIVPAASGDRAQAKARIALLARLRAEPVIMAGKWLRDELYDDAP